MENSSGNSMKRKFGSREQNEILCQPRQMHGQRRQRKKIFEREIAVADGVEAIGGDARKSEIPRERLAIEGECASRQRARTQRASIRVLRGGRPTVPRRDRNASPCASSQCESSNGWACCMCVVPGIGTPKFFSACSANAASSDPIARNHFARQPASRTSEIPSPPFHCGCARYAASRRAAPAFRSARFRRNDGRLPPAMHRARPNRFARVFRFHRGRR